MALRRHGLSLRRKAVGFTQESFAERLGVERTTVVRWEAGETELLPGMRPKIARALQISVDQLSQLLSESLHEKEESSDHGQGQSMDSVQSQPQPSDECGDTLNFGTLDKMLLPVIVNGRLALVPLNGKTDVINWDTMSPSNRRLVLGYGFAATAASVLGAHDLPQAVHRSTAPLTLSAPAHTSWAKATYDAVLNPMGAARRATNSFNDGVPDPPALRVMIDRTMRVSLSSDYGALEQALPTLIGYLETATMQPSGDVRAAHLAVSDVYAIAGWTLIKADSPVAAWIAAQRAIQAA